MITETAFQHDKMNCKDLIDKNIEVRPLSGVLFLSNELNSECHLIYKQSSKHFASFR